MRKAIFAAILFAAVAPAAFAQDEYKRGTFGVQYNHNRVDTDGAFDPNTNGEREGFNGVSVNAGYNFHKFAAAEFDFSHVRKDVSVNFPAIPPVPAGTIDLRGRLTQFLGGVRIQDNRTETNVRPFARALVGLAHASAEGSTTGFTVDESETGFGAEIGGGVDIKLNDNVDVTAISIGWNPTRLESETQNNFKIGVGLRFRF